jgi:hypothetical protein
MFFSFDFDFNNENNCDSHENPPVHVHSGLCWSWLVCMMMENMFLISLDGFRVSTETNVHTSTHTHNMHCTVSKSIDLVLLLWLQWFRLCNLFTTPSTPQYICLKIWLLRVFPQKCPVHSIWCNLNYFRLPHLIRFNVFLCVFVCKLWQLTTNNVATHKI